MSADSINTIANTAAVVLAAHIRNQMIVSFIAGVLFAFIARMAWRQGRADAERYRRSQHVQTP